jgi:hypothetical protein
VYEYKLKAATSVSGTWTGAWLNPYQTSSLPTRTTRTGNRSKRSHAIRVGRISTAGTLAPPYE